MEDLTLAQRIKGNPVVLMMTILALVGSALTAVINVSGYWDANHTTDAEMMRMITKHADGAHVTTEKQLDRSRRENLCATIDLKISIVEGQIWQMEQVGNNTQRLVEKKRELHKLETKHNTLHCSDFD